MEAHAYPPPRNLPPSQLIHGFYSADTVLPNEDPDEFEAYRQDFYADVRPATARERAALEQMIHTHWLLRRTWMMEAGVYNNYAATHPPEPGDAPNMTMARCFMEDCESKRLSIDRLSRHGMRYANAYHKAGTRLELLQDLRRKGLIPVQPDDAYAPSAETDPTRWNDVPSTEIADGAQASDGAPEAAADSTVERAVESATGPGPCDPDCPDCAEERALAASPSANGTSAEFADGAGVTWLPPLDATRREVPLAAD